MQTRSKKRLVFFIGFNLGKYTTTEFVPDIEGQATLSSISAVKPINIVSYSCDAGKVIIAKYFQGECSTSYDLTGDDILSFRLGYTDEDVAASPGYPWIIMKLKSGKIITFVINDIVQEKSNVE